MLGTNDFTTRNILAAVSRGTSVQVYATTPCVFDAKTTLTGPLLCNMACISPLDVRLYT